MEINWDLYAENKGALSKCIALIFYLISTADGSISDEEQAKISQIIEGSELYKHLSTQEFDMDMLDAKDIYLHDYQSAIDTTKEHLQRFKGKKNITDFLIQIAQQIIVSDKQLHVREEVIMKQLCDFLGTHE